MHLSTKYSIAVHCLIFIYEYGKDKKVTSELLALSTGSNPVTIRNIISSLKKEGIISVKFGTGGAAINCPLKEISLYRIYSAVEPDFLSKLIGVHPAPSPFCPVGRNIHKVLDASYEKIRGDLCRSLQSVTLDDIVNKYHQIQQTL
ncbi:MAG: Rrf2 family transcriptional regulator [Hungatella sp.]|jgi:DNA-binding IscR family transcriptional regulator|nr:Rrf2 family transcriptional regulator [Hungatella sp.]